MEKEKILYKYSGPQNTVLTKKLSTTKYLLVATSNCLKKNIVLNFVQITLSKLHVFNTVYVSCCFKKRRLNKLILLSSPIHMESRK